jgi:hypothetical protein
MKTARIMPRYGPVGPTASLVSSFFEDPRHDSNS